MMQRFRDRKDAGRRLAAELRTLTLERPIVLALPRGGVPVGYEIARALSAPLDVWVVRKIGVPWHPELGVGAVAEGGHVHLSHEVLAQVPLDEDALTSAIASKRREVEERVRKFRGDRSRPVLRGRTAVVVDDGIATGGTVRATLRAVRAEDPKEIVLAVPVAAPETLRSLERETDRIVALLTPPDMFAIGLWYEDFSQLSDDEVVRLLDRARQPPSDVARA